ncbi:biotin-dependent carboxyltransferase family protein [Nocardia carnea]|uniref:5-oxoprolinase subunit C family protein n=1 Tax=Nocardia carnea TaxID=37328 RepID=UPI002457A19E|nr:allophanate hydrolase [Nocardia carnea]
MAECITVREPGNTVIQDLGRYRAARVGQMTGGALDRYSAEVANALVASDSSAPLLELLAADFAAVASTDLLIAVTGAPADVRADGLPCPRWEPFVWRAGTELTVRGIRDGLRVYLAVHGAIAAERLLGSCAPDSVLGFGHRLTAGSDIAVEVDGPTADHPHFRLPVLRFGARPAPFPAEWTIDVTDGPDAAEFADTGRRLFESPFVVGVDSNHIGLRLTPVDPAQPLPRRMARGEVLSRGVPIGAVEVPAGDQLLVLHRGRGVTAGYPVLAVVTAVGLSRLGQVRPGQRVLFRHVTIADAVRRYRAQQAAIERLRTRVAAAFAELRIPVHITPPTSGPPSGPANPQNHLEYP